MTWYKQISVEVPMLLLIFGATFAGSIMANLMIYRTCYDELGYNKTQCAMLGNVDNNITEHLEKLVQPTANVINTIKSTSEAICSMMVTMFLGPWSDRFGRKFVMIFSLLGSFLTMILTAVFSYFENISPWYFLIVGIPSGLLGGFPTFITVALSYLSDTTTLRNRGMRMAILDAVIAAGSFMGNISGPYAFYATSYTSVISISAGIVGLSVLYTIFYVPESVQNVETVGRVKGLMQCTDMKEMLKLPLKKRRGYNRSIILLMTLMSMIAVFIMNGDGSVTVLFLREKLHWTLKQYTLFNSGSSVAWILGTMIGSFFLDKLLKVTESVIILIGLLSVLNGSLLLGFASTNYHIYAATSVKCLGGVVSPMVKSLLSKVVDQDESGKIFSVMMITGSLISLPASPLYTVIYNSTIDKDPGIFNFVSAGLYVVNIAIIMIVMSLEYAEYMHPTCYNRLENEDTIDENSVHIEDN